MQNSKIFSRKLLIIFVFHFARLFMNLIARLRIHRMQQSGTQIIILTIKISSDTNSMFSFVVEAKESFVKLIFPSGGKWTSGIKIKRKFSRRKSNKKLLSFSYKMFLLAVNASLLSSQSLIHKAGRINFHVKHFPVATVKRAHRVTIKKRWNVYHIFAQTLFIIHSDKVTGGKIL